MVKIYLNIVVKNESTCKWGMPSFSRGVREILNFRKVGYEEFLPLVLSSLIQRHGV